MKAIEPRLAGARQLEPEGFRFHPAPQKPEPGGGQR